MTTTSRIRVWDPLVRLFHWSLVAGVAANLFLTEEGGTTHQWIGYGIAGLIGIRIVWGFIGPWSARWKNFWPTPSRLKQALRPHSAATHSANITHTAPGAVMMLTLLALLIGLAVTGYMMEETTRFWGVGWVKETHEVMANALLLLVPLHVIGAIVESIKKRDNLIGGMVHGYRRVQTPQAEHDKPC